MTRTLKGSLLIASTLVVLWATTSEACHRRRAAAPATYSLPRGIPTRGTTTRAPQATTTPGAATARRAEATTAAGMAAARPAIPAYGYDFGRPGYNPGGLGGPWSGLGVRPGLGFGAPGIGVGGGGGGLGGPASGIGVRPGLGAGGLGRGR